MQQRFFFSSSSHHSSAATSSSPVINSKKAMNINNRSSRTDRRRQRSFLDRHYFAIQFASLLVFGFCMLSWSWIRIATSLRREESFSSTSFVDTDQNRKMTYQPNPRIESVISFLMNLAKLPPRQLWDTFGMEDYGNGSGKYNDNKSYGKDPFSLKELEQGKCPSNIDEMKWLPPRPYNSEEIAAMFQGKIKQLKEGRGVIGEKTADVMVWYEHLSKAGGTTFCGLAKTNLGKNFVPRYYCMPKKLGSKNLDGRVGSWTNEELIVYSKSQSHYIVANEWDPFNIDKLTLSGRTLDGRKLPLVPLEESPRLLFVTTLRDPSDRLLSTYLFFRDKNDPPDLGKWMKYNFKRLQNFRIGEKNGFRSNVARYNAIVWRYSGGTLRHSSERSSSQNQKSPFPLPMTDEKYWIDPFETAIRALSQHDLILPMDIMTKEEGQKAMQLLMGWDEFAIKAGRGRGDKENGHIVTTGEIRNSNAREYLSEDDYRFMWEANWLDNILVLWCRAVFLARLHCQDAL